MKKQLIKLLSASAMIFCLTGTLISCDTPSSESSNNSSHTVSNTSSEEISSIKTYSDPIIESRTSAIKAYDPNTGESDLLKIDDGPLPYRLYTPDNYDGDTYHYPLFVFLHGAGERGNDNSLQLKNAVQNMFNDLDSPLYQSIAIFPQCPKNGSNLSQWVDTPWSEGNYSVKNISESDDIKSVLEIIQTIKENYNINNRRVYIMGVSMGGFGTWDLLMRHTTDFAAAIPLCGGGDPTYAYKLVDTPIWTVHGAKDDVVPVASTREMVSTIQSMGSVKIKYTELENAGHNVWDYASTNYEMIEWLFSQIKN